MRCIGPEFDPRILPQKPEENRGSGHAQSFKAIRFDVANAHADGLDGKTQDRVPFAFVTLWVRLLSPPFSVLGVYAEKQKVLVDRSRNLLLWFGWFGHPVDVLAYPDIHDAAMQVPNVFHLWRRVRAG